MYCLQNTLSKNTTKQNIQKLQRLVSVEDQTARKYSCKERSQENIYLVCLIEKPKMSTSRCRQMINYLFVPQSTKFLS